MGKRKRPVQRSKRTRSVFFAVVYFFYRRQLPEAFLVYGGRGQQGWGVVGLVVGVDEDVFELIPMVLVRWRAIVFFFPDFRFKNKGHRGLRLGVKKGVAREGEDDLRVFRWNSVDLVVEKTWRKFLKKIGEEREEVACLRVSCRAEDESPFIKIALRVASTL